MSLTTKTHDSSVDKDGNEVSEQTKLAVESLRCETRNLMVLCHWSETGRIGVWAKGPNIVKEHIDVARDMGYELDHATTREKHGKIRGYAEFIPQDN